MAEATSARSAGPTRGVAASILLALGLFTIYSANRRAIGAGDVVPATLLPVAMLRGDGPRFDRFAPLVRTPEGRLPGYADDRRGHAVSRYPIGPALVALPFEWPQLVVLDALRPGWERDPERAEAYLGLLGKNAAAAIASLAIVLLYRWLRGRASARAAMVASLTVALGTDHWAVASQALWQHGPAALCLMVAILLIEGESRPRLRLALAGLAAAMLVACRPVDLVASAVLAFWVMTHRPRPERWAFTLAAGAGAVALCAYNLFYFDTLTGGYAAIEAMHPWAHGTRGSWTAPILQGAVGTLFSPSHGLFAYSPWIALAVALACLPGTWSRTGGESLGNWLIASLGLSYVVLAKYSCWWGGHCFGPRFWIDVGPIFGLILARALDWASAGRRWGLLTAFGVTIAFSVALQAIGAACYPSTWHGIPNNADRHHERLWDWRDNEVTRGWNEGPRPRDW